MLRIFSLLAVAAAAQSPLETLRKQHPRLIALDSDLARIRATIEKDAGARAVYTKLKAQAEDTLSAPPVEYRIVGPRLLAQSRRALDRVYTLALLYRLDGERKYLERALAELRAAAAFPDWNPSHFLDTAEMTHAFAIGYDWLYPVLTGEDRAWLRRAIVEKGLHAALPIYRQNRSWTRVTHNWNQVCNGGIAIGALAVAEDEAATADYILNRSVESIKLAMASYAPDGGWAEGPGYWHYATRYNVYYLAALDTALGHDFGLSRLPGFAQAGDFRVYFTGPSGLTFNYADAGAGAGNASEMFWLARKFQQPVYAWEEQYRLKSARPDALDLVWYQPEALSPKAAQRPAARVFEGVDVAFLRSDWDDPDAIFVAVKGGDNKANHSHLDLGSFVLDALGVRWAVDLGPDDYNLPQYFGKLRWTYYRLRTESHNTLLIDGENQDPKAAARIVAGPPRVRIDLSAAYPGKLQSWTRHVALEGRRVAVRDAFEAVDPVEALWGMTTDAEIVLRGREAVLEKSGKRLSARIEAPKDAAFDVVAASGSRKLVVRLPAKVKQSNIAVTFRP